jgi:hypothetical protein
MITIPGTPSNHATMYLMMISPLPALLREAICAYLFQHPCRTRVLVGIPLHAPRAAEHCQLTRAN